MNTYQIVSAVGEVDNIEGDSLEVNHSTGQAVIYKGSSCMAEIVAIIPPTSSVKLLTPPKD